jgi:RNA polymerase primary sigma factor
MKRRISTSEERYTTVATKAFKNYLQEVSMYTPLTPDEEFELSLRMVDGDEAAREKLIKHNLRFVISVAKQYYSSNATLEDLVNEGNYGLIIASKKYDPSRGFKFITYAVYWIRNTILRFINTSDNLVRIPNHKLYIINKIKEKYVLLEQQIEGKPSFDELKVHIGDTFTEEDIHDFFNHTFGGNTALDTPLSDNTNSKTGMEMVENDILPNSDVYTNMDDSQIRLKAMLGIITNKKHVSVITKIYGLDGGEPLPIEVVSREMGLSKERVRQIKEKSLLILRNKLKNKYIYS